MFLRKSRKVGGDALPSNELLGDYISTKGDDEKIILIKETKEEIHWELFDNVKLQGLLGMEFRERLNRDFSFEQTIRNWAESIEEYTQKVLIYKEALWSNNFRTLRILFEENSIVPIVSDTFLVFSPNVVDKGVKVITRADFQKRFKEVYIPNLAEFNSPFKPEKIGGIREISVKNRVPRIGIRYANFTEKGKKGNKEETQVLVENSELNVVGFLVDLSKIYKYNLLIPKFSFSGIKLIFPIDPELVRNIRSLQRAKNASFRYFPLENTRDLVERILVYEDFIKSYEEGQTNFVLKVIEQNQENLRKKLEKKATIPEEFLKERENNFPEDKWKDTGVKEIYGEYPYLGQVRDTSNQRYFWLSWNYLGILPFYQLWGKGDTNFLKLRVRRSRIALEEQAQKEKEKRLLQEELFSIGIREVFSPSVLFKKQEIAIRDKIPLRLTLTEKEFQKIENYLKQIQKYIYSREVNQCPHFAIRKKVDFNVIWDEHYSALDELLRRFSKGEPEKATQKHHCCNCGFPLACHHEKLLLDAWKSRNKEEEVNAELEKNYYEVEGGDNEDTDNYIHCRYCGRKIKDLNLETEVQFDDNGKRVLGNIVERETDYLLLLEMEIDRALVYNRFQGTIRAPEVMRRIMPNLDFDITHKVLPRKDTSIEQKKLLQKAYIVAYIYAYLIDRILRSNFRINFEAGYYKGEAPPKNIQGFGIVFLRIMKRIDPFFLSQLQLKDIKIGPILISAYENLTRSPEGDKKGLYKPYILQSLTTLKKADPNEKGAPLDYMAWLTKKKLAYYRRIYADKYASDEVWRHLATLEGTSVIKLDKMWKDLERMIMKILVFPDKPVGYLHVKEKDKYFNFTSQNYFPNGAKRKAGSQEIVLKNLINGKKLEMKEGPLNAMLKAQVKEFNAGYEISGEVNALNSPDWLRTPLNPPEKFDGGKNTLEERSQLREKVIHYENSQIVKGLLESSCSANYVLYFPEANYICGAGEADISQKLIDSFLKLILPKKNEKAEPLPEPKIHQFTFKGKLEVSKIIDDNLINLSNVGIKQKKEELLPLFSLISGYKIRQLSQLDFIISVGRRLQNYLGIDISVPWEIIRNANNLGLREKINGGINLIKELLDKTKAPQKNEVSNITKDANEWATFYHKKVSDYKSFEELQDLNTRKRFELFQRLTPEEKILKGLFLADFREDQELFGKLNDEQVIEDNKSNIEEYEETDEMMEKDYESTTDEDTAFLGTNIDFL